LIAPEIIQVREEELIPRLALYGIIEAAFPVEGLSSHRSCAEKEYRQRSFETS